MAAPHLNQPPQTLPLERERIPTKLTARDQWVCWKFRQRPDGTWTKEPINVRTGALASTTNPLTWASFDLAYAAFTQGSASGAHVDGIGYVFAKDDPFVGIDLDKVFDSIRG